MTETLCFCRTIAVWPRILNTTRPSQKAVQLLLTWIPLAPRSEATLRKKSNFNEYPRHSLKISKKMNSSECFHTSFSMFNKAIVFVAFLATISVVNAGHIGACTVNLDGTGGYDSTATKECCPPLKNKTWNTYEYNRNYGDCRSIWPGDNGLNTGAMVDCCTSKGKGSHGE